MYKVQELPDKEAVSASSGNIIHPIVTLKDEYGGISHICKDDGCYVLYNGSVTRPFALSSHWYPEASEALAALILNDSAKTVNPDSLPSMNISEILWIIKFCEELLRDTTVNTHNGLGAHLTNAKNELVNLQDNYPSEIVAVCANLCRRRWQILMPGTKQLHADKHYPMSEFTHKEMFNYINRLMELRAQEMSKLVNG